MMFMLSAETQCFGYSETSVCLVWFGSLHPSQQLWSCWDGQFTKQHFFPGQARLSRLPVFGAHSFACK